MNATNKVTFDNLTPIIKDEKMTNTVQDYGFSADAIKDLAKAEKVIGGLKDANKENTQTINQNKMVQIVTTICHVAKFPRTASGNLSKAVTKVVYDDLMNHAGIPKAQAKILKENGVKFADKHDLSTQVTPDFVKQILTDLEIDTQTKWVAHTNDKKELTLGEKICKMVYGAEKTKKVDGVEQTIFVPTDLTMDEINQIEEHMADIKRVRIATDAENAKKLSETTTDNKETNDVLDALTA